MKEKILLVNPWYKYKNGIIWRYTRVWPPLDLAIAAALLEQNSFNTSILDINAQRTKPEIAIRKHGEFDKVFITSSPLDRWQCPHLDLDSFLSTVEKIREHNPDAELFVMGYYATVRPKEILRLTKANAVIIGEPEFTILDICQDGLSAVKGIVHRKGKKIVSTPKRALIDMSGLPVPAFHLLPMNKYYYEVLGDHFTLLETARGCPFQCTFCAKDVMYGRVYRKKPLENIEREVEIAVEDFGVKSLYFIDLEFTVDKIFVNKICDILIEKNYDLRWTCQTRADSVNDELLKKMKRAGCKLIHYGVESGSPRVLNSTKKRINHEQIRKSIELTKRVGIDTICFMMIGLPGESKKDMDMTIRFAKEISPTYVSFNVATPYPGTVFHETVKNELNDIFPTCYDGIYSEGFLRHMTRRAFIEFYLRPRYLFSRMKRSPKFLWSQMKLFARFIQQ